MVAPSHFCNSPISKDFPLCCVSLLGLFGCLVILMSSCHQPLFLSFPVLSSRSCASPFLSPFPFSSASASCKVVCLPFYSEHKERRNSGRLCYRLLVSLEPLEYDVKEQEKHCTSLCDMVWRWKTLQCSTHEVELLNLSHFPDPGLSQG